MSSPVLKSTSNAAEAAESADETDSESEDDEPESEQENEVRDSKEIEFIVKRTSQDEGTPVIIHHGSIIHEVDKDEVAGKGE